MKMPQHSTIHTGFLLKAACLAACAFCMLPFHTHGQTVSDLFLGGVSLKNAAVPIYDKKAHELAAVAEIDRVFTEQERRGFFRIALLPVGVLEGLKFQIQDPDRLTNSLARISEWMSAQKTRRLELRQVTFVVGGTQQLSVERIRPGPDGRWELLGAVLSSEKPELKFPQGTLQLTGAGAGAVIIPGTAPQTNFIHAKTLVAPKT